MQYQGCSIFFYDGYVGTAPTVVNSAKVLEKRGYVVTVFASENKISQPEKIGETIEVIYLPRTSRLVKLCQNLKLPQLGNLFTILSFNWYCLVYLWRTKDQIKKAKSTINIVVDLPSLLIGWLCFYLFQQKFMFMSLELPEPRKNPLAKLLAKTVGNLFFSQAESVIIQDSDRLQTLSEFFQADIPNFFYLPNSPLHTNHAKINPNFFREKFNLSTKQFPWIISQAGMINDHTSAKALAESFAEINSGCALVLHGVNPNERADNGEYLELLEKANSRNLILSLNPVPYEQVDDVYASSTIGLALYANVGSDNFTKIGMASGKLAYYLKHGKPVLISNLPSLVTLNEKYHFGEVITNPANPEEIQLALHKILNSYKIYSQNAKNCFQAEFDFEKKMSPIVDFMDAIALRVCENKVPICLPANTNYLNQ
jgi:glycosyltransferase involved in cell wall biosynthesis